MDKIVTIFDHTNYRRYLELRLPTVGPSRGIRSKLAEVLHCQSAFISRVLHGEAHFSLEAAASISRFLEHSESESEYFLLLVHHARAGSKDLETHYEKQLARIRAQRELVSERIQVKQGLGREDEMTYYSSWHYAAIHTMLLVPHLRTPQSIAQHLHMPLNKVTDVLEFLVSVGLAVREGSQYVSGASRIHLDQDSPMISKHHTNWRMRAIDACDRRLKDDLFFSGPISVSRRDRNKIRSTLLQLLEEIEPTIRASKEEAVFCLSLDLFEI